MESTAEQEREMTLERTLGEEEEAGFHCSVYWWGERRRVEVAGELGQRALT